MRADLPPPRVSVFAPSPVLTITIEAGAGNGDDVHLHAGGQGFWVARMATLLGAEVTVCAPLGGETGRVLSELVADGVSHLRAVPTASPNGAYVHDRRGGEREPVAQMPGPRLLRHEVDELYGAMTAAALDLARRRAHGHRAARSASARDLSPARGRPPPERTAGDRRSHRGALAAALEGGLDVLKLSHDELAQIADGPLDSTARFVEQIERLRARGAANVLVSRADQPALASIDGDLFELGGPRFEPLDSHGAGDSMVAALAVGIARGLDVPGALRLAMAAGALNVTRRGLGSGDRGDIELLAETVEVQPLSP